MRDKNYNNFLDGFQVGSGIENGSESESQWAGMSRNLSEDDLSEEESGGYESGMARGQEWKRLFAER